MSCSSFLQLHSVVVCTELTMSYNFFIFAELIKLHGTELHSIVDPEALHLLSCLLFDHNLLLLEDSKHITLMLERIQPNFSKIIIN